MVIEKIQAKKWEQLYVLTDHWKSDIEFYRDDLHFLYHLINKNFMWITNEENLSMVKTIKQRIYQIKEMGKTLLNEIERHKAQLALLIEGKKGNDVISIEDGHIDLEQKMAEFVKSFRENRKKVFSITEYIIDTEELPNMSE